MNGIVVSSLSCVASHFAISEPCLGFWNFWICTCTTVTLQHTYCQVLRFFEADAARALDDGQGVAQALSDVKDGNGRGPLHFAARGGCNELCQYMVEELKLPVDPKDNDGIAIMDLTFSRFGAVFCVKDCFLEMSRERLLYFPRLLSYIIHCLPSTRDGYFNLLNVLLLYFVLYSVRTVM